MIIDNLIFLEGRNHGFVDREGRDVREVRMGGDTLMAGIRPRISFKQKTRVALPRNLSFAAQNFIDNDDDLEMSVNNNRNDFSERQVILKGRSRLLLNGRLGAPPKDLRSKLIQTVLADAFWYKVTVSKRFYIYIKKIIYHEMKII